MNLAQARAIMKAAKCQWAGKPLGNNTRLKWRGTHYAIRLHDTDILDILPNGSYRLRTGGWRTKVAKERLNEYLPWEFNIYSEGGKWRISRRNHARPIRSSCEFEEGMTIGPRGGIKTKLIGKREW